MEVNPLETRYIVLVFICVQSNLSLGCPSSLINLLFCFYVHNELYIGNERIKFNFLKVFHTS